MFALCFMFGGIVAVTAQETQDTTSNQYRTETESQYPNDAQAQQHDQAQHNRERIQSTELPDEVKRTLEGTEYRGWLISGAFKAKAGDEKSSMQSDTEISAQENTNTDANRQESTDATGAEQEEIYIVELKNGAETKTLRFDKEGQKLEGMDENESSQYNQNEPADPTMESGQTDPSATDDPAEQSQNEPSTETRTDPSATPESTDTDTEQATETDTEQSTETQSSQSTPADQSKANEPK